MNWVLPDVDNYFESILKPEGFEIDHLIEALKYCTKFRLAIDGGAHIGTWSAYMAGRFDKVLAFEPASDSYDCLIQNINRYKNVYPRHVALGEKDGYCKIVDDPMRIGNTGARLTFFGNSGKIPVVSIDSLCLHDLDFLKLDLEGAETFALKGAVNTIINCKPTIVVECKEFSPPRGGGVQATKNFLNNLGYKEVGGIRNDRVFVSC